MSTEIPSHCQYAFVNTLVSPFLKKKTKHQSVKTMPNMLLSELTTSIIYQLAASVTYFTQTLNIIFSLWHNIPGINHALSSVTFIVRSEKEISLLRYSNSQDNEFFLQKLSFLCVNIFFMTLCQSINCLIS